MNICIDFDGVIHSYKSGWQGIDVIPDPPTEGVAEALTYLKTKYTVVVFSARCRSDEGVLAIREYLDKHGIPYDEVAKDKPPAVMYIDDRGVTFNGSWDDTLFRIQEFEHWLGQDAP